MNSTITLYYNSKVNSNKNFILDNNGKRAIESYLSGLTSISIAYFQYIKQELSLSIKVELPQEDLMMGKNSKDLNYIKIQNDGENPYYYFVVSKKWKSKNTIEVVLSMDTLNTFEFNTDYVVNKKTLVKREHKDRFVNEVKEGQLPIAPYTKYYMYKRTIDLRSEEIAPPLYKEDETIIINKTDGLEWSLYYKNKDDPVPSTDAPINPVKCLLVPNAPLPVNKILTNNTISRTDIPTGKYAIIFVSYNINLSLQVDGVYYTPAVQNYSTTQLYTALALYNDGTHFKIYVGQLKGPETLHPAWQNWNLVATDPTLVYCQHNNMSNTIYTCNLDALPTASQTWTNSYYSIDSVNYTISLTGTYSQVNINTEQDIDKTDPKNIKLIALPYSPSPYEAGSVYKFDPMWEVNTDLYLELVDDSASFINEFSAISCPSPMNELFIAKASITNNISTDLRSDVLDEIFESKLYHSDYYRPKFVYDSFNLNLDLEKVDGDYYWDNYYKATRTPPFRVKFVMSRNIVSKFMFMLPQYKLLKSTSDYDNIICVSRNNERVLYNSQYIDYIRMGYNYDLKAKEKTDIASGIGIGLNALGLFASIGLSFVPGGQAIGVASAIGSGLGLTAQVVNYAKSVAQAEENIQRKLIEAQNQAVAVKNADDIDLLQAYSFNKAKLCLYKMSEAMKKAMSDLFYYCGYSCYEQKVPNVQSRKWFNFVQCELVIDESSNLPEDIEEDIKQKFMSGVTFMHYKDSKFDINQTTLNLEKWMYNIS